MDAETGRIAQVEGLLYRLIVRLHRYSLGKHNYCHSRHWKSGLILDDGFNGRAFVEDIGGDIRVTVRAAYPERFLAVLCDDVYWLVESFWKGLDCRLSVPCHAPCKGLHELEELLEYKHEGMDKVRCSVCKKFHLIDSLLATVAPKPDYGRALAELKQGQAEILRGQEIGFAAVNADLRRLISQADEQFAALMTTLTDPAKDGPRLFSFEAVETGFWDLKPDWVAQKFRLVLWCEHSRLPLPVVSGDPARGVYEVELSREWLQRAAPVLKVLANTLSLALPVAMFSVVKVTDAALLAPIEKQLEFGRQCAEAFLTAGEQVGDWLVSDEQTTLETRGQQMMRAKGATLRELHALLRELDSSAQFGGLVRVQNKQREFLWVYEDFVEEY